MIKPDNVLFYFCAGSKTFCNNATDEDLVGVQYEVEKRVDRYNWGDVFYWSLDTFRQLLKFECPIENVVHKELYNISFAIRKEKGEVFGEIPADIANYTFFDYKEKIIKSCIKSCETYALNPRLTNPDNEDMCLKHSYWIFANYFALVNNSLDFTEEQLEIIQKCHDNELPRSYVEDLYQKLLAMLPKQEQAEPETEMAQTLSYDELVDSKIRARYTVSQEFAILRQRDTKPDEFAEYNAYCEQCKAEAKAELGV